MELSTRYSYRFLENKYKMLYIYVFFDIKILSDFYIPKIL